MILPLSASFSSVGPVHLALLFATALAAGAVNAVAGGGTLLTFPALLLVLGPQGSVLANGTSTVALVPGSLSAYWAYRRQGAGDEAPGRAELWRMAMPSLLGGAGGAWLAVHIGAALFSRLVPWLILGATFLFLIQDPVRRRLGGKEAKAGGGAASLLPLLFQLAVAVYGGFFGAGIGILMLAALGFLGQTNIHRMNGLKNFAAVCINGVGALTFIHYGQVRWPLALLMAVAAVIGGFGGAGLARRVGQANVRRTVVAIGLLMGFWTLARQVHHF